jgi:hypothetical protein
MICSSHVETQDPANESCRFVCLGRGQVIGVLKSALPFYPPLGEELLTEELSVAVGEGTMSKINRETVCKRFRRLITQGLMFRKKWISLRMNLKILINQK